MQVNFTNHRVLAVLRFVFVKPVEKPAHVLGQKHGTQTLNIEHTHTHTSRYIIID